MRIADKTISYDIKAVTKFCCHKMKKYIGNAYIIWMDSDGSIHIGYEYKEHTTIKYCPFCGEKIDRN